jgi:hypothetical protein
MEAKSVFETEHHLRRHRAYHPRNPRCMSVTENFKSYIFKRINRATFTTAEQLKWDFFQYYKYEFKSFTNMLK